ncbi:MAG: BrnT family toxin [Boseongicola sp. SB0664_bin_43]|uniref:BrnT family toxin n=1 Tax=Boseongicola sp. SB0664_bin_43 TaxID=2604844 RepID=A0A6B0Y4N4_9RHOB|nr:BrnT family toxin [Boseongicola sp. SB0664_bin_43]MYK31108.1 BrnT family toxin [Boseongicola sp. SB0670_bin_30]
MLFEWDDDKNLQNIAKDGLSFDDASRIFGGFTLDLVDDRFDYGEVREVSIGMIDGLAVVTVVHTSRDGVCRIISARPATRAERIGYEQAIQRAYGP